MVATLWIYCVNEPNGYKMLRTVAGRSKCSEFAIAYSVFFKINLFENIE